MEINRNRKQLKKRQKDIIFVACWAILPLLQYVIFYVFVNFNSILLAFKSYEEWLSANVFSRFNKLWEFGREYIFFGGQLVFSLNS